MPKIINSVDLNRMKLIESNKELINLDYLEDQSNSLTKLITDLFFNWKVTDLTIKAEWLEKLKILNHTIALPYKIATTKARFFWYPQTNIEIPDIREHVVNFVYGWFSVFAIDEIDEDWKPIINQYNPEQYIKGIEFDMLVTYLRNEKNETFAFIKEFPNDKSWIVRNILYKIVWDVEAGVSWIKVELNTLDQTAHLEEEDNFWIEETLLYTANDFKLKDWEYWTPQFNFIKPLLNQLNVELVNIKDQFIKHLQAKLAIQGIDASKMPKDAEGQINIRDAEALFIENGSSSPEYVQNRNDLLKDAVEIIDKYIGWIATTVSIPKELVWLSGQTGTESTESKSMRYSDFIKDIEDIHTSYKSVFAEMFEVVTQIDRNYLQDSKDKEFSYIQADVMPKDSQELATELNTAKIWGFISNYTAVKRYTGFEWKELDEELARINDEEARSISNVDIF